MTELTSEERQARIAELHDEIDTMLSAQVNMDYSQGEIRSIPVTERGLFMPDEWMQECVFQNNTFDVWLHRGPKGSSIPYHSTPKHTVVIVVTKGSIQVCIDGETQTVSKDETVEVRRNESFGVDAIDDVELVFIYYPLLGKLQLQKRKTSTVSYILCTQAHLKTRLTSIK